MEEVIVKVENLSHRYSVQWAVRDMNFEILKNGIYGLLGSNGAGKSTTMNIMCGVLKPTRGNVFIKGINMRENPVEAKRHIGFLPQQPPLHVDLTVEEYLEYCASLRHIPGKQIHKAVIEVMGKCGISHFQKRLIRNLSGGYQQRVGIAQAIIHKPDFVVLDEPTNGLDPNQIMEIRHLVKEIAEERTVVLSTHILSEVQATCKYIRMIEQGSLVFSGTVEEFDNYKTFCKTDEWGINSQVATWCFSERNKDKFLIKDLMSDGKITVNTVDTRFRLHFANAQEMMEKVVEISMMRDWRLNEIYLEKSSLDTIFAKLSKK